MEIVFSSNEAGTFNIDILIVPPGHNKTTIGKATVTMQEVSSLFPPSRPSIHRADWNLCLQLLQRQRDRKESIALGLAEFNVNKLVAQLNKS